MGRFGGSFGSPLTIVLEIRMLRRCLAYVMYYIGWGIQEFDDLILPDRFSLYRVWNWVLVKSANIQGDEPRPWKYANRD